MTIERRLAALESKGQDSESYCIALNEQGEAVELPVKDWYENRDTLSFVKFSKGYDHKMRDVMLVISSITEDAERMEE